MYVEAALIGICAYILFKDLPDTIRSKSLKHSWIPHLVVFGGLFMMHGGSAEGTVIAGIATVIFRWLMHRGENKPTIPRERPALYTRDEIEAVNAARDREDSIIFALLAAFAITTILLAMGASS